MLKIFHFKQLGLLVLVINLAFITPYTKEI